MLDFMNFKLTKIVLFLVVFVLLGLFREYVFVNINNLIYFKYYKNTTVPIPYGFGWLTKFSYGTLYYLKYPLTVFFVFIYFVLSFSFLKQMNVTSLYTKTLILSYIAILFISTSLMMYAYFFHQKLNEDEYTVSRGLMGIAQSPLICFVLFALYLWDKNKLKHHEKRHSSF